MGYRYRITSCHVPPAPPLTSFLPLHPPLHHLHRSQFYTTFSDASARDLALDTFRALDKWHSPEYGGYTENAENGFPSEALVDATTQSTASGQLRTLNVILHGTEALTALHKATGGEQAVRPTQRHVFAAMRLCDASFGSSSWSS